MGGKAFTVGSFPRIPTAVYNVVKARLLVHLQSLYTRVGVPYEAPEKPDHGDFDFLVVGGDVSHEDVKKALGATMSVCLDGNRTSNFAVPASRGEWEWEGVGDVYYQVDVHVCADDDEWKRIFFYHSYGDLGMILGLLARNNGLALGTKGLKLLDPPNPPFDLCSSFPDILAFLGLSYDRWETQGFSTKQEIFEWVASSRLFDPAVFRVEGEGIHKVKKDRKMYAEFVIWVGTSDKKESYAKKRCRSLVEEALAYFDKKKEFDELARERDFRKRLKVVFSPGKVSEWLGLMFHDRRMVRLVVQGVRERLGGDQGVLKCWEEKGEGELRRVALEVKNGLCSTEGLTARFARGLNI